MSVELLDGPAEGEPGPRFSRVAEVSCEEPAFLSGDGDGPALTRAEPGSYRLRLMMDETRFPTRLTVQSWPAAVEPGRVLRGAAAYVEPPAPPHPVLSLPECPAGVAAAARIGNDVAGGPGARALSGELGVAHARVVVRRTPAWNADYFDRAYTWMASSGSSQGYYGFVGDPIDPDTTWLTVTMRHEEQQGHVAGWYGAIWSRPHDDDDPPRRRVHWWRWVHRTPPPVPSSSHNGDMLDPVLPWDTLRVVNLNRVSGTPVHTEITVEHRDVPVEWVDDLNDWWALQLAIHAARVERATAGK